MSLNGNSFDSNELILSYLHGGALEELPPETQLSTVRHMMETLLARVDAMQQNQAVQLAGVHDRLDAVELELPLIQEQSALRMRDMETRLGVEIEQAARSAVEEATMAATAAVQEEVAGKFNSLAALMEAQRAELRQMHESKIQADTRLNRAVLDIERLCGSLVSRPEEVSYRIPVEPTQSPFRSRISEHIRKAAIEFAPGEENPLHDQAPVKKDETDSLIPVEPVAPETPQSVASVPPAPTIPPVPGPIQRGTIVPGFDAWKRQFMQDGEPLVPTLAAELGHSAAAVACPRCLSDRTRPATLNSLDHILRLANFTPHRCRSCSHRFYKRGSRSAEVHAEQTANHAADALETQ